MSYLNQDVLVTNGNAHWASKPVLHRLAMFTCCLETGYYPETCIEQNPGKATLVMQTIDAWLCSTHPDFTETVDDANIEVSLTLLAIELTWHSQARCARYGLHPWGFCEKNTLKQPLSRTHSMLA